MDRGVPVGFFGRPLLLPLAAPAPTPPAPADFFDEPVNAIEKPACCIVGSTPVVFEDHGDPGEKLKRLPAALSSPFLSVFMTAKLGIAFARGSLALCREPGAVKCESMLRSGFVGFFVLPEVETRIVSLSPALVGVGCRGCGSSEPVDDIGGCKACGSVGGHVWVWSPTSHVGQCH